MNWFKKNLFPNKTQGLISAVILVILLKVVAGLTQWLIIDGVWSGTAQLCRESDGACLVFIREKFIFILFGFFPREELWRAIMSIIIFMSTLYWSRLPKRWNKKLIKVWVVSLVWVTLLMHGGFFGLSSIGIDKWGGLPLTLMLSFIGVLFSYPIGVLLALGRTGKLPLIRMLCIGFIELIRGVPMISLLFMASVMFPLLLPEGVSFPKLLRAQIAIIMFMSAYLAEVFRGGLAAIDKGQYEAADSLGLNYFQKMSYIILPQALKLVIPPTVNTVIGMFKDTSLVVIIGLFDLLMTTRTSLKDPKWLGFAVEGYLFVGFVYFILCYSMSRYARGLEDTFHRKENL